MDQILRGILVFPILILFAVIVLLVIMCLAHLVSRLTATGRTSRLDAIDRMVPVTSLCLQLPFDFRIDRRPESWLTRRLLRRETAGGGFEVSRIDQPAEKRLLKTVQPLPALFPA